MSRPPYAVRLASQAVFLYLQASPLKSGKYRLWHTAAKRFLVKQLEAGVWIRTSGLTNAEWQLFMGYQKESDSVSFIRELIHPGMVAFDVGANIGYYTLILTSCVGSTGAVYAFEPTPSLAARVRSNLALNGITFAKVAEVAVSDSDGVASLHVSSEDPEANSLYEVDAGVMTVPVATLTLDSYVASAGIKTVNFVKIDCEGAELSVLRGARALLERDDAPMLLVECNPLTLAACGATVDELCEYLRGMSYHCYGLERLTDGPNSVWNVLAAKSNHIESHPVITRRLSEFQLPSNHLPK